MSLISLIQKISSVNSLSIIIRIIFIQNFFFVFFCLNSGCDSWVNVGVAFFAKVVCTDVSNTSFSACLLQQKQRTLKIEMLFHSSESESSLDVTESYIQNACMNFQLLLNPSFIKILLCQEFEIFNILLCNLISKIPSPHSQHLLLLS